MHDETSTLWLVAEDSDDDFFLLQRACSRLRPAPKLLRATDGVEAQEYLARDGQFKDRNAFPLPSLVLSDLNMPHGDGLHLLTWFKSQPWPHRIPFVLLTSSDDQKDMDQAKADGVDKYLLKSSSYEDLAETLARISVH